MRLRIRMVANGESEDLPKSSAFKTGDGLSGCQDQVGRVLVGQRRKAGTRGLGLASIHHSTTETGMGGFGSTRWGRQSTRATTEGLLALDVRVLGRRGYFTAGPGEVAEGVEIWSSRGSEVGRISVEYRGADPQIVTLEYRVRRPEEDWHTIQERVELNRTRCTFGGSRPWFVCPGCRMRRAVLFCVGGVFRCRVCHDLAYRSTREEPIPGRDQPGLGAGNDL
jgi:hypothetical protein